MFKVLNMLSYLLSLTIPTINTTKATATNITNIMAKNTSLFKNILSTLNTLHHRNCTSSQIMNSDLPLMLQLQRIIH